MTKIEIAIKYYERIKNSSNPQLEIQAIIDEISKLTYDNSNETLSLTDKKEIVSNLNRKILDEIMNEKLSGKRITKSFSNVEFIDLVNYINSLADSKIR